MTDSDILARVQAFANELVAVIRADAVDVFANALANQASDRPRGSKARSARVSAAPARGRGQKRDPQILAALTEKLGAFIKKNPGQRIEQIGTALGVATKELALPVKKLVLAKQVSTKGQKRATTYFPR